MQYKESMKNLIMEASGISWNFIENQPGVLLNVRKYVPSEEGVKYLVLRAHREKKLTYNALEEDIAIVNFYFDESDVIQYTTFQRMTVIDFISSV